MTDKWKTALDIAVAVNRAEKLEDILSLVVRRIGELLEFDRCSVAAHARQHSVSP